MVKTEALLSLLTAYKFDISGITVKQHRVFPFADVWYLDTMEPIKKFEAIAEDLSYKIGADAIYVQPDIKRKLIKLVAVHSKVTYVKQTVASQGTAIPLGMGIEGPVMHDFKTNPHLLIAGTTGSGKSCFVQSILINILRAGLPYFSIVPIDFKRVELPSYEKFLPPTIRPVKDILGAKSAFATLVTIMDTRYREQLKDTYRDIDEYNAAGNPTKLDRIFVVIDEFAAMMRDSSKKDAAEIESYIVRLAQKSRAAGIHLIIATQSPRADVITGLIKANIEARVALKVVNDTESSIILDETGAAKLGKGSFLYKVGAAVLGKVFEVDWVVRQNLLKKLEHVVTEADYNRVTRVEVGEMERSLADEPLELGETEGVSTLAVVASTLEKYQKITAQDLLVRIAADNDLAIDDIHFAVQCALAVLESEGAVKNIRPIGTYKTNANYNTFANWTIINKNWKDPDAKAKKFAAEGNIDYKTGRLTEYGRLEVTEVLRNVDWDRRIRILQRVVEQL